jgi:pyridine nucleotide-disulfide oxidoreductase family protein
MRLLLVGCGHAHLFVLEALATGRLSGFDTTLVSPDDEYYYSGMIPGVVAGCYHPDEARFRPPLLARAAGARWVQGRVERVDAGRRRAVLADGAEVGYDVLSFDVGSRLAADDTHGMAEHAVPAKPMRRALAVLQRIEAAPRRSPRLAIVGGGAAGVEMGICLAARLASRTDAPRYHVDLLEGGDAVLAEHPPRARRSVIELLGGRSVTVHTNTRVERVEPGVLLTSGGERFAFDVLVWATGPRAPGLFRHSHLPTDGRGYLSVDANLRVPGHPELFGAGDCAVLRDDGWVPRAGVYAVRQGPVLVRNLDRFRRGQPLEAYRPQRHWLSLMNTGDGRALAVYRGISHRSRAAWWLKDRIDRRFMRRFQRLERGG